MTQNQAYGMLVFFGIIVVMAVRSKDVTAWQALVFSLFGFSLALTGPGYLVIWILHFVFSSVK